MTVTLNSIPRSDGFRMPAEFETHAGCWMLWPEREDVWRLGAGPAQQAFTTVAEAIASFEPVSMGVSANQYQKARSLLPPQVRVVEMSSNDAWMRDIGPTFVTNDDGIVRGVDWQFNAWGGLYTCHAHDDQVALKVLEIERFDRYLVEDMVLEGGSTQSDGQGTLITTEECLLNPDRNPGLSKSEIECRLQDYMGVEAIIWLPRGVFNDETSGHIDNLCCFLRSGVVALTWTYDRSDPQFERSAEAYEFLTASVDALGRNFEIHKIPQPAPQYMTTEESLGIVQVEGTLPRREGRRLAASYVNFYLANRSVLVPQFGDPLDLHVLQLVQGLLPDRKIQGLPAREILLGGGNIHCITLQQPLGRLASPEQLA